MRPPRFAKSTCETRSSLSLHPHLVIVLLLFVGWAHPALANHTAYRPSKMARPGNPAPAVIAHHAETVRAAHSLLVRDAAQLLHRDRRLGPHGRNLTVVAGSPHFDPRSPHTQYFNWGRDTAQAIVGLLLPGLKAPAKSEAHETAKVLFKEVVTNVLRFHQQGIIPNLIGDGGLPRYNSFDATGLIIGAVESYIHHTKDWQFLHEQVPSRSGQGLTTTVGKVLARAGQSLADGIDVNDGKFGTYRFAMSRSDGLLRAGTEHTHLTWMDAKPENGAPETSRHGAPVEINADWVRALRFLGHGADEGHLPNYDAPLWSSLDSWHRLATHVRTSFLAEYIRTDGQPGLYDVIGGDPVQQHQIRSNQLFAVKGGILQDSPDALAGVAEALVAHLLTPHGVRSLSPRDPRYKPQRTSNGETPTYHNGLVWGRSDQAMGETLIAAYGRNNAITILSNAGYFTGLKHDVTKRVVSAEIWNGDNVANYDYDYNGTGCHTQAWTTAARLQLLHLLFPEIELPTRAWLEAMAPIAATR